MNRLSLRSQECGTSSSQVQVEMARITGELRGSVPHALFAPLHYERNYAYPLLVWLHGPYDDERQLQRIMPLMSMRNYVAVGPRGCVSTVGGRAGFGWKDTPAAAALAEQHIVEAIAAASARFNIAPHRIFLAGLESGGTLACRIAFRYPDRFAGVLSIGGRFPQTDAPLARLTDARGLPLFIAQGRDSTTYPVEHLCCDLALLHSAGMSITLRQYPCGDELNTQMLNDMDVWMMEIVTGQPAATRPPIVTLPDMN